MKRVAAAALLAGVVGGGVWLSRHQQSVIVASSSRLGRNTHLAKMGARTGGRWAAKEARKRFASAERRDQLDEEFELKTTEDVVASLGNLKGAMMKLGQMASYLDLGLPENARLTLAQLQTNAPPMSGDLAAAVIEEELGQHPDQLFAEWDPHPIASASIGQVHRAMTHDGHAVAVKVQYPGVAEAIDADLRTNDTMFSGLRMLFPGMDTLSITEELRDRLSEELDYELEASNQQKFADYFDGHPYVSVPQVLAAYSGRRVITSELAVGSTFDEVLEWSQEERDLVSETLFRFSFGSIYRLSAFNGDPHPGNYIFHGGGQITFLDFGLVKHFSPDDDALFQSMIENIVVHRDIAGFRRDIESIGLLPIDDRFSDELIGEYFQFFYDFVLEDREFTFNEEYSAAGVRQIFETGGDHGELKKVLNVPPAFVVLQRINLGLMSIFGQLESTANWRRVAEELWPFVGASPSTDMGRAIERWGRASGRRETYGGL